VGWWKQISVTDDAIVCRGGMTALARAQGLQPKKKGAVSRVCSNMRVQCNAMHSGQYGRRDNIVVERGSALL
jgi:hypothetical protein